MTNPEQLKRSFTLDSIQEPDVPEFLLLDVTTLLPEEAAEKIQAHLTAVKNTLHPATRNHLRMR